MPVVIGYDVGGAHLKVARIENGRLAAVRQVACPLWTGLTALDNALVEANDVTVGAEVHAVTMTGELTECFASRDAGVISILQHLAAKLSGDRRAFIGLKGFASFEAASNDPLSVASANFLATAKIAAARRPRALLIDMGSTTTDIVACDRPQGLTDAERLQSGELVYTGVTRTVVPSVTRHAPLAGQWQTLAADNFASMADVRRLLGELPDDVDQHPTADGRGKTVADSLARFARGFGRDAEMRHLETWKVSAAYVRECQLRAMHDGALQVLSRPGLEIASVVAAGIGAPVAEALASRLGLPSENFGMMLDAPQHLTAWATSCAPAVAVALLAAAK